MEQLHSLSLVVIQGKYIGLFHNKQFCTLINAALFFWKLFLTHEKIPTCSCLVVNILLQYLMQCSVFVFRLNPVVRTYLHYCESTSLHSLS